MPYWELFYHIVTATKGRLPLISEELELVIYSYLKDKAGELEAVVYAINGTCDHVHLVVSVPPKISLSTFVGQIKGYSSTQIRQYHPQFEPFSWQSEYGVFSFDKKRIAPCIAYVEGQKQHHAQGTFNPDPRAVRSACPSDWRGTGGV